MRYPKPWGEAMQPQKPPACQSRLQGFRAFRGGLQAPPGAPGCFESAWPPGQGRRARNGPFPFKNDLFLLCSTIAEIRSKFDHFGLQMGRWPRNGPFPFKKRLFLVYSTIAEIRSKFYHFGPQKGRWARNGPFLVCTEENQRPRATPKPKLAPVWSGQVQLADPDPIVRDWKHPARAPSEENQRPRATPKPKLAPVLVWACRPKSSCSRLDAASSQVTV